MPLDSDRGYDLIGDIHGCAHTLARLLERLGYRQQGGVWRHPSRQAIFLGDLIDRGPGIRETLHLVRAMVEAGQALCIMGNHEFNALGWSTPAPPGSGRQFVREHSPRHQRLIRETLAQFEAYPQEWREFLDWFYELPLFLDAGRFRVVHACWDQEYIDWLIANGRRTMTPELLVKSHDKQSKEFTIIEALLKGKEIPIPEQFGWLDKDGHLRTENRIKWWVDASVGACGDFLFDCPPEMISHPVPLDPEFEIYDKNAPPVFFGHYWLKGEPEVQAHNVVCLDYSIAKDGALVADRWEKGVGVCGEVFGWGR